MDDGQELEQRKRGMERTLCHFADDTDPRVRATAVHCLLAVAEHCRSDGWILGVGSYEQSCHMVSDISISVRISALRLVKHFADFYPEEEVEGRSENVQLRLVDDAFSRLCNAMHDAAISVRTEAAFLLGSLSNISYSFLEQTLDKKLMKKLRCFKGGKLPGRENYLLEWSTGRKFGEDIPAEKLDEDVGSLIPSGACGAFVTGLEDEYMAVRLASVRSLSQLAAGRPDFAAKALDFLADMFNDEIEAVRLESINCLRPLVRHCQLKEDQVETVLIVLDDAAVDSRGALRELLGSCKLATLSCLKMTVEALLSNLHRYPGDKTSIWECMKALGTNHAGMVQALSGEMLGLHPFFDTPEPQIENSSYVAKLILVLNATVGCPPLRSLLPPHIWRHYHYLRESNPHLVPVELLHLKLASPGVDSGLEVDSIFNNIQKQLSLANSLPFVARQELTSLLVKDLERLCHLNTWLSSSAEYLLCCCEFRAILEGNLLRRSPGLNAVFPATNQGYGRNCWSKLLRQLEALGNLSVAEKSEAALFRAECRLRMIAARYATSSLNTAAHVPVLLASLDRFKQLLEDVGEQNPGRSQFLTGITSSAEEISDIEMSGKEADVDLRKKLLNFLTDHYLWLPSLNSIKRVEGKSSWICEPTSDSDLTLRFVAGLVTAVQLTACFRNFSDSDVARARIRVLYPDTKEYLFKPRASDFRRISEQVIRLRTDVLLSSLAWSEAATVTLQLVLVRSEEDAKFAQCILEGKAEPWVQLSERKKENTVKISLFPKTKC